VVAATKWMLDGTGIERLSLLRTSCADRPGWAGALNFPPDTLQMLLREALAAGEQPVLQPSGTVPSRSSSVRWRRWPPIRSGGGSGHGSSTRSG
jgi:hypothetical protein